MVDVTDTANSGGATLPEAATCPGPASTVLVWDPLVRVFHWSLVGAFVIAWVTGDELERLHELAGYTIAGLLAVRVVWGLVGTTHARFTDFVYRPSTILRHLADTMRLRAKRYLGHNPAGGAMAIALMAMLAVTTATGIAMSADGASGGEWLEELHEVAANLSLVLVGLHLAGVFVTSVEHRENLVKAMISGRKRR
jgi:cytochrome b